MIDVYTWVTGNCHKIHIILEELGLPYNLKPVNIFLGEQLAPDFLKLNPNNKIPVIIDHDGPTEAPYVLFESGAILLYLAEKTGKLIPQDAAKRFEVIQWLMFQVSGLGPYGGQALHFRQFAAEKIPYAIDRYTNEMTRQFRMMDGVLKDREFIAGDYSIADIALFPWVRMEKRLGQEFSDYPHIKRWHDTIAARPAVTKAITTLADRVKTTALSDEDRSVLFGKRQYSPR